MDGEHTTLERGGPIRSSHKSGHMTARTQRIELITRGERRRRWSIEEKREIVAEATGRQTERDHSKARYHFGTALRLASATDAPYRR
jgi:transposase